VNGPAAKKRPQTSTSVPPVTGPWSGQISSITGVWFGT